MKVWTFPRCKPLAITISVLMLTSIHLSAQNIGIGTTSPGEKLEVGGIIYSSNGGIKFPDFTIQTTAANNVPFEASTEERSYIIMELATYPTPEDTAGVAGFRVVDFSHRIFQPFDVGTGQASGAKVHEALNIGKAMDASTPLFLKSLAENQVISSAALHFLRLSEGALVEYFTIDMQNCKIVDFKPSIRYLGGNNWAHIEEISIIYEEITYTDIGSGNSYTVIWNIP